MKKIPKKTTLNCLFYVYVCFGEQKKDEIYS